MGWSVCSSPLSPCFKRWFTSTSARKDACLHGGSLLLSPSMLALSVTASLPLLYLLCSSAPMSSSLFFSLLSSTRSPSSFSVLTFQEALSMGSAHSLRQLGSTDAKRQNCNHWDMSVTR